MQHYSDIVTTEPDSPFVPPVPIVGASVYVLKPDGTRETLTHDDGSNYDQPATTGIGGLLEFNVPDPGNVYLFQYRYGGRLIREAEVIIGNPPQYKGDPGGNIMSVGFFTQISSLTIPAGTDVIMTSGYRALGIGEARLLRFKPPMANLPAIPAGTNPWWTTAVDGSIWYVDPSLSAHIDAFGAYGDDATDDYPAWLAVHHFCSWRSKFSSGDDYSLGGEVQFGMRDYFMSSPCQINTTLRVSGPGTGMPGGSENNRNFHVRFAACDGFVVNNYNTKNGAIQPGAPVGGGNGTIIRGLTIVGAGQMLVTQYHGVRLHGRAIVTECAINLWSGCGLRANSNDLGGNVNGFAFMFNRIILCGTGILAQGGDGNAGNITGNDIANCIRWGIEERSFLANTYVGNQIDSCGSLLTPGRLYAAMVAHNGAYWTVADGQDAAASTTEPGTNGDVWIQAPSNGGTPIPGVVPAWVSGTTYMAGGAAVCTGLNAATFMAGLYTEGSQPPIQTMGPGVLVGGDAASGVVGSWPAVYGGDGLISSRGFRGFVVNPSDPSQYQTDRIGTRNFQDNIIEEHVHTTFSPNAWGWYYDGVGNAILKTIYGQAAYYTLDTTRVTFGRNAPVIGQFGLVSYALGNYTSGRIITMDSAPPTTGYHAVGEIVENNGAITDINTVDRWRCSVAGTPGTWIAKS